MGLQPVSETQESGQIDRGLKSPGHLRAAVPIEHPGGNRLPGPARSDFHIFDVATAEVANGDQAVPRVEWVKRIPDRNVALVTGIIPRRLQPVFQARGPAEAGTPTPDTRKRKPAK